MTTVAIVLSEAGYHWEEAAAAYKEWDAGRWEVVFYTPTGAVPTADPTSTRYMPLPLRAVGYGTSRRDGPESGWGRKLLALIESPRSLGEFDLDGTDVIYVVGGHGCLQDINRNEDPPDHQALYLKGCVLPRVPRNVDVGVRQASRWALDRARKAADRLSGHRRRPDDPIRHGAKAYLPLPVINDESCGVRVRASRRAFARRPILTRRWSMSRSSPASAEGGRPRRAPGDARLAQRSLSPGTERGIGRQGGSRGDELTRETSSTLTVEPSSWRPAGGLRPAARLRPPVERRAARRRGEAGASRGGLSSPACAVRSSRCWRSGRRPGARGCGRGWRRGRSRRVRRGCGGRPRGCLLMST